MKSHPQKSEFESGCWIPLDYAGIKLSRQKLCHLLKTIIIFFIVLSEWRRVKKLCSLSPSASPPKKPIPTILSKCARTRTREQTHRINSKISRLYIVIFASSATSAPLARSRSSTERKFRTMEGKSILLNLFSWGVLKNITCLKRRDLRWKMVSYLKRAPCLSGIWWAINENLCYGGSLTKVRLLWISRSPAKSIALRVTSSLWTAWYWKKAKNKLREVWWWRTSILTWRIKMGG